MSVALGGNEYFLDRVVSGILTICSEQFVGVLTSVACFAFGVEALLTSMEFFLLLTFLVVSIKVVIAMISFDFKWFDKGVFDWLTSMELLLRETNFSRFK